MSETLVMQTDLDRLAERVRELEQKLQGQDVPALIQEVSALRRVQRDWENERRDVASRVESLVKKLEKLEA